MASPLFMRDVTLKLSLVSAGTYVEYNCDVSYGRDRPGPGDVVEYSTLCPEGSYSSRGKTTYALHVVAAQRWDAADGLAAFLWDHDGELAKFQYQAHGDGVVPSTADARDGGRGDARRRRTMAAPSTRSPSSTSSSRARSKPTKIVAAFPARPRARPRTSRRGARRGR